MFELQAFWPAIIIFAGFAFTAATIAWIVWKGIGDLKVEMVKSQAKTNKALGELKADMSKSFGEMKGELKGLKGQMSGLEGQVGYLGKQVSGLGEEVRGINEFLRREAVKGSERNKES